MAIDNQSADDRVGKDKLFLISYFFVPGESHHIAVLLVVISPVSEAHKVGTAEGRVVGIVVRLAERSLKELKAFSS